MNRKYVAIKLEGFKFWIWFKFEDYKESGNSIFGKNGWGNNGESVDIESSIRLLEGKMYSDVITFSQIKLK